VPRRKIDNRTCNNGDMIRMQELSSDFKTKNPASELQMGFTLDEECAFGGTDKPMKSRQEATVRRHGPIGTYEASDLRQEQGWLPSLDDLPTSYDVDDLALLLSAVD